MPIIGMTNRGQALPQIGIIRKGSPKRTMKRDGREIQIQGNDLDYFRVEFDETEVASAARFKDVYGEQPKQIRFVFPFNEVAKNWDAYLEAYTASRLLAQSDGNTVLYWRKDGKVLVSRNSATTTEELTVPILISKGTYQQAKIKLVEGEPVKYIPNMVFGGTTKSPGIAKPVGRMTLVLKELGRWATMSFITTSKKDIISLSGEIESILDVCHQCGVGIAGPDIILRRRPESVSVPKEDGTAMRMMKSLVHVELDPAWVASMSRYITEATTPKVKQLSAKINMPDVEEELDEDIVVVATDPQAPTLYTQANEMMSDPAKAFDFLCRVLDYTEDETAMILKQCEGDHKVACDRLMEQEKGYLQS